jgi:hypothetical protein
MLHVGDNAPIVKTMKCWESFGNFVVIVYRYKGQQYKALPKASDGSETYSENEPRIPHVFHK